MLTVAVKRYIEWHAGQFRYQGNCLKMPQHAWATILSVMLSGKELRKRELAACEAAETGRRPGLPLAQHSLQPRPAHAPVSRDCPFPL